MATELMEDQAVSYNELYRELRDTRGITLTSGTDYKAGMLLVSTDGIEYEHAVVALTTDVSTEYNIQVLGVLLEDVDATDEDKAGIVANGVFNRENIVFASTQTEDDVVGVLQAKNIILQDWSE